jgi:hypothetical protein
MYKPPSEHITAPLAQTTPSPCGLAYPRPEPAQRWQWRSVAVRCSGRGAVASPGGGAADLGMVDCQGDRWQ